MNRIAKKLLHIAEVEDLCALCNTAVDSKYRGAFGEQNETIMGYAQHHAPYNDIGLCGEERMEDNKEGKKWRKYMSANKSRFTARTIFIIKTTDGSIPHSEDDPVNIIIGYQLFIDNKLAADLGDKVSFNFNSMKDVIDNFLPSQDWRLPMHDDEVVNIFTDAIIEVYNKENE